MLAQIFLNFGKLEKLPIDVECLHTPYAQAFHINW